MQPQGDGRVITSWQTGDFFSRKNRFPFCAPLLKSEEGA